MPLAVKPGEEKEAFIARGRELYRTAATIARVWKEHIESTQPAEPTEPTDSKNSTEPTEPTEPTQPEYDVTSQSHEGRTDIWRIARTQLSQSRPVRAAELRPSRI